MAYPQEFHPGLGNPGEGAEAGQPPEKRLYAGKYTSVEELEKGYLNMQTVENQNRQRLDEMEQRFLDERVNPGARSEARKRPEETLEEMGIPPDAIGELVDSRVEQRLKAALDPLIQGAQAREQLRQTYGPDFEKLEAEVAGWITQTPEIQVRYRRMFAVDQGGAMQWAIDRYKGLNRQQPSRESASGADAGAARLDAMLPGTTGSGNRGADLADNVRRDKMQAAYKYAVETGDWGPYQNLRISEVVPDSHTMERAGGI